METSPDPDGQSKRPLGISVIMTVWNGEAFVLEAIQSVIGQSYRDFEMVIVDDGSTDRTPELLRGVRDERVRLFGIPHAGRGAALNYATRQARAPILAFMDADDIADPNRLALQLHVLNSRPEVGVVSGWYRTMRPDGTPIRTVRLPRTHPEIAERMFTTCAVCFGSAAIRKELIVSAGGFREDLQSAVDYDLLFRLMNVTEFLNIEAPLVNTRLHLESISGRFFDDQRANALQVIESHARKIAGSDPTGSGASSLAYRLGVGQYCYGSMRDARKHLIPLLGHAAFRWKSLRYILPSFGGDRLFRKYRNWRYRRL